MDCNLVSPEVVMSLTALLVLVIVLFALFGGGYYWRARG